MIAHLIIVIACVALLALICELFQNTTSRKFIQHNILNTFDIGHEAYIADDGTRHRNFEEKEISELRDERWDSEIGSFREYDESCKARNIKEKILM